MNPENSQASVNLAVVLANTGRIDAAKETLRDLLNRNPSLKAASEMLQTLQSK